MYKKRRNQVMTFKSGEKIKVLNSACMDDGGKDNMPVLSGKIWNKTVEVLQDTDVVALLSIKI